LRPWQSSHAADALAHIVGRPAASYCKFAPVKVSVLRQGTNLESDGRRAKSKLGSMTGRLAPSVDSHCGLPVQFWMDFEWDPKKAKTNKAKRGVDFELAKDVFREPARLSSLDDSSADEERWRIIGLAGGKVLFVVYVERDDDVIRIISAREASKGEERHYFGQAAP